MLDTWQCHRFYYNIWLINFQLLQLHFNYYCSLRQNKLLLCLLYILLMCSIYQNEYFMDDYEPILHFNLFYKQFPLYFMKEREDDDREDSLQNKARKDPKLKPIKKKANTRQITHYFSKVQKQAPINRNIPTPDKAAIQQFDQAFVSLQQQEQQLLQQIQQAKVRAERQKEERQYFLTKSRALLCGQLKKISEINRFFKHQSQLKLKEKEHLLKQTAEDIKCKKEQLDCQISTPFQLYFLERQLRRAEKEREKLAMEVILLADSNRIAQQEESCYFAKEGWPLLLKRYQPLQLIGKGGFSEVYRSYDLYSNQTVAIKLSSVEHLLQGCGNKHEYLKHIKRQYEIHKQLDHPNIVKLIEVIELETAICIVLEYCEGYTLAQYLKTEGCIPQVDARMIIKQIAKVINYLSSQVPAIIHYDLKPQNIIFSKGQLKVLDFGICKTIDSQHSKMALTSQGMGTCCYLPPQTLIPNNPVISNKVDVWSLGIIFYELINGSRPFQNVPQASYLCTFNQSNLLGECLTTSQGCRAFIFKCLQIEQSKRLDPLSILSHPYLSQK